MCIGSSVQSDRQGLFFIFLFIYLFMFFFVFINMPQDHMGVKDSDSSSEIKCIILWRISTKGVKRIVKY